MYTNPVHEIIDRYYVFSCYTIEGDEVLTSTAVSPVSMAEACLDSMKIEPDPVRKLSDELKRVLTSEPRTAKDFEVRGRAYLEIGEYGKAIEAFESAIELAPEDKVIQGTCHNNIGLAYMSLQQHDRALSEYEKAMSYEPGAMARVLLKMNMLKALYELKEYKRAAELIEDLKYARKYLDSQLGREVIEEILSKSESSPNPNNK
jgi:tetratricopeptide (TPR) repeat protein